MRGGARNVNREGDLLGERGSHKGGRCADRNTMRSDWVPALVLALAASLATYGITVAVLEPKASADALDELTPFAERYGPERFSQFGEEWLIRDFFQDRRNGVFLDVGANHYRNHSTTYYLEKELGWSGIAVEAQPEFAEDYGRHRPRTKFVAMFAADTVGEAVDFYVPTSSQGLTASSNPDFSADPLKPAVKVPTTTLTAVLDQAGVATIDFMSMDIELSEPAGLKGFDIDRFRPELVCIEAHPITRDFILDYFDEHGYRLVGKYLRADTNNLYFSRP